jgi:hypothetical protein
MASETLGTGMNNTKTVIIHRIKSALRKHDVEPLDKIVDQYSELVWSEIMDARHKWNLEQHQQCAAFLRHITRVNPSLDHHVVATLRAVAESLDQGSALLPFPL